MILKKCTVRYLLSYNENYFITFCRNFTQLGYLSILRKSWIPSSTILSSEAQRIRNKKCLLKLSSPYLKNQGSVYRHAACNTKLDKVKYGVPQGSIIVDPLLFLLHRNFIIYIQITTDTIIYAAETNVFFSVKDFVI